MTINIAAIVEPYSEASLRAGDSQGRIAIASSQASRTLKQELRRYCDGEINGRSMLIAGHRGSGKTTTVLDALVVKRQEVVS